MNSTIVKASEIVAGDTITECDTPEGPFYRVVKVNPKSVVIHDTDYDLTLRLPIRSTDSVRKAVGA